MKNKKLAIICLVGIFIVASVCGVLYMKSLPVGHEDLLEVVKNADAVEETQDWVIEPSGVGSADDSIQRVFKKAKIDGTPLMYIGYQLNPDGIDYGFTVRDKDNVQHLFIVRQTVDNNISVVSDSTDFDLLDYFI